MAPQQRPETHANAGAEGRPCIDRAAERSWANGPDRDEREAVRCFQSIASDSKTKDRRIERGGGIYDSDTETRKQLGCSVQVPVWNSGLRLHCLPAGPCRGTGWPAHVLLGCERFSDHFGKGGAHGAVRGISAISIEECAFDVHAARGVRCVQAVAERWESRQHSGGGNRHRSSLPAFTANLSAWPLPPCTKAPGSSVDSQPPNHRHPRP